MLLGYNTNGMAHHRLTDAIELLAELGYQSVAITVDHHSLNPFEAGLEEKIAGVREILAKHDMRSVVETGARFLLDSRHKHEPTLMAPEPEQRSRRIDFYRRCIDLAASLESRCVSLWSGALRETIPQEDALARLAEGLGEVIAHAQERNVMLGFEPEPGMFIDTMASFERLLQWVDSPMLQLTIDVGHLYCQAEVPIVDYLERWRDRIINIHIEDMRAGVHEHLMFSEGEMDFPPILDRLASLGYRGPVHVELSRHSHEAPYAAQRAFDFLRPLLDSAMRC